MPVLLRNAKKPDIQNIKKISLIFYMYIIIGIILSLGTFVFADRIILILFGDKFSESVFILKSFSLTILLWPLCMFSSLVLLAYNKYNYILIISVTSMIQSILFSIFLINLFGVNGTGFILPAVAIGTIIISYTYLKKISVSENFNVNDLYSFRLAVSEFKSVLSKK
jgi:O-antigen/teichoic acid export membrane protein